MGKFAESIKIFGNIAAMCNFCILMGLVITVYVLTHTDDAELFPSPVTYLDAQKNFRGNLFYQPVNGGEFCLGDELVWQKNMRFNRSTRIQRSYYLQVERPYNFTGTQAKELVRTYTGELLTTRALFSTLTPSTHISEGFFDGGIQAFPLPTADELKPHEGIKPGDQLRLYIDVEAPFSQANGYYVPFTIAEDCPVIEPTARQNAGELSPLWAGR